jgi:hypothetical protein
MFSLWPLEYTWGVPGQSNLSVPVDCFPEEMKFESVYSRCAEDVA